MRLGAFAAAASIAAVLASAPAADPGNLTFRRADGSAIPFDGKLYVWCGRWESEVKVPALDVFLVPRRGQSYWRLSAVLRDIRRDARVRFPIGFVWNRPEGAQLFVYDRKTKNGASSEEEKAKGVFTFSKVTCRRGRSIVIRASGVLGSVFEDGPPVRVSGIFRGTVGRPPLGPALHR
jgi:hypothetical protein